MADAKRIDGFEDIETDRPCYFKDDKGTWYLYLPGCGLGNLADHDVTEHQDGTITVSPSILVTGHDEGEQVEVHGYLEKGIWRDC